MTTISNLFSNFNDLTKKSVTDLSTDYNQTIYKQNTPTPALTQGKKFKRYQKQIKTKLEDVIQNVNSKEGFQGGLTQQNSNIINANDYSSQQGSINNLKHEYQNTLTKYEKLIAQINGSTTGYLDRVNPNNPYLNKTIGFTSGEMAYVTNQGVVKQIPSTDILKSLNIPQIPIPVNIGWNKSYSTPGANIPTIPQLISGTPMKQGQSVGNEGINIFVNKLIDNPTTTYKGCYADNTTNPLMTFIGGAPSSPNLITNGNFDQPKISNNSYKYLSNNSSTVPGWEFNCVLLNNSSAWGYPMPYPNGNQCVCIQKNQQLWTNGSINFSTGVTYTLTFSACGRNCCDGSGLANPINIGLNGNTIYTLNATVNKWNTYTTSFTVQSSGGQRISFMGDWTSSDRSTAIQNIVLSSGSSQPGTYKYDSCKSAAIDGGYQYFALQNVDASTSTGFCAVSNSEPAVTSLGLSTVPSKLTPLWASNTSKQTGNSSILTDTGSLSVINSGGQSVFNSPNTNAQPSNYLGCYGDKSTRAMTLYNNGSQQYNLETCQQAAAKKGATYFGLQNSISGNNAQCTYSSNFAQTSKYGKSGNCTQISDGSWSGGGWSNSVYNTTSPDSNYYLILEDSGNMCVYRGTSPKDNQGQIWCSETNGKQQSTNPQYAAAKGKYGKNWIPQGSTLAAGDFVGSNTGNIALIMQSDGNLVLYTFTMETNCAKMTDGNTGGNMGANAVYNLGNTGVPSVMTNLAYIDQNSELHSYPTSNTEYSNTYTKMPGMDSSGSNIQGATYSNTNVDSCEKTCNNNTNCAGFAFSNNTCYPKTAKMYPNTARSANPNVDLYIRGKTPIKPPIGVPKTTNNIDSISYNNYISGGRIGSSYGLSNANSSQQQQLSQLQTQLDQLTAQLTNLTGEFGNGSTEAEAQVKTNMIGVKEYLHELERNNNKITGFNSSIENILNDSDIVVLQKNYDYLFWSILATGTVLVAMNIMKK